MSLWDDIKGAFGGDDEDKRSREMVMTPPPPKPVVKRMEGESDLDYSLRKRKEMFEYKKMMEDRELNPENYLINSAEAGELEGDETPLRDSVENAYNRSERTLEKMEQ